MSISPKQRQQLKAKAHALKPIVFIGNQGLTENVKIEIDRGLEDHELIKIRIQAADRETRRELFHEICNGLLAHPIQLVGGIGVIYRVSKKTE